MTSKTTTRKTTATKAPASRVAAATATRSAPKPAPKAKTNGERRRVKEAELDYDGVANVPSFTIRTSHSFEDLMSPGYWDGALATGLRLFNRIRFTCEGDDSVTCGELVVLAVRDATGPDGGAHDRVTVGELWRTTLPLPASASAPRRAA